MVTVKGMLSTKPLAIAESQIMERNVGHGFPPVTPSTAELRISIPPAWENIPMTMNRPVKKSNVDQSTSCLKSLVMGMKRVIGVTTFLIRYLVRKLLYSNELKFKSIFRISGTREEFPNYINYIKTKMEDLFLSFR
jgi:hypothetical protein